MNTFILAVLFAALPTGHEWQDNQLLSQGSEPTRAAFVPFATCAEALKILPEFSSRQVSLDSDTAWKFNWAKDPSCRPVGFEHDSYDVSGWPTIKVPCSWQALGASAKGGWGTPIYHCHDYPFAMDVPGGSRVMLEPPTNYTSYAARNPVGSYRRTFTLPKGWRERGDVFLKFDGVDSFYYLWVNGYYIGFAKDSRTPSEFNVTERLREGENTVALEVYRYSDGAYLEDQDMFRLSGIFRSTWLISRPKARIRDFFVTARPVAADGFAGDWRVTVQVEGVREIALYTFDDKLVWRGGDTSFVVKSPKLWSAEDPNCYKIVLFNGQEYVSSLFGFRVSEIKNGRYQLNGRKVKFKGANRHESDPLYGHYVPHARQEQDIALLKAANCNAVRNSHYPQDDYWYYLCDTHGIYLCDEANVETHGYGFKEAKTLSRQPKWEKAFVQRNLSMVARNKNHPSVVVWSFGNESGAGTNFHAVAHAVKAADATRPTHYEGDPTCSDIKGKMYPPVKWVQTTAAQTTNASPSYLCEYAHNMGNALGNLADYQEAIESSDVIMGGTIWDWVDQGLYQVKDGVRRIACGGDFGDEPNTGFYCLNGCVLADRTREPGYWEIRKVYQNWAVKPTHDYTRVVVRNKNYFISGAGHTCRWNLFRNGEPYAAGEYALDAIPPQTEFVYDMPSVVKEAREKGGILALRITFLRAGTEVAWEQIDFPSGARNELGVCKAKAPQVKESASKVDFTAANVRVTFDKWTGLPSSFRRKSLFGDEELLNVPVRLDVYRTPSANDVGFTDRLGEDWSAWGLMEPVPVVRRFSAVETKEGACVFSSCVDWQCTRARQAKDFNYSKLKLADLPTPTNPVVFRVESTWTVRGDGILACHAQVKGRGRVVQMGRVGLSWQMRGGEMPVRWFGRGPWENYRDRKTGAFVGLWRANSSDFYFPYMRNEDCGNHEDTYGFAVGDLVVRTLGAPFAFEVNPYAPDELLLHVHPTELGHSDKTFVGVFAATRGLGGHSCGPLPLARDIVRSDATYTLDFTLSLEDRELTPRMLAGSETKAQK